MALTKGGYELGLSQDALTKGVRTYYDRQQDDRNLLLGGRFAACKGQFEVQAGLAALATR